jgi:hypothetical protein
MNDLQRDRRRWCAFERALVPFGIVVSLVVAVIGLSS